MYTLDDLKEVMRRLRAEDGCPWDKVQTHESMKKYLVEETAEVFEAIDNNDPDNLCEELGDVLFQVVMYSQMASEIGAFTIEDVVDGVCEKMIRRHPHVFGDVKVNSAEEGLALWKAIKEEEKASKKAQENVEMP